MKLRELTASKIMFYFVRHLTKFHYASPVSESVMEVRMHPRSDGGQRCLTFHLSVSPRCRVFSYRDYMGNNIHHFDIPGHHSQLVIVSESLVERQQETELPDSLANDSWHKLDAAVKQGDYWEMLLPSEFARPTPALLNLAKQLDVCRRDDPLRLMRELQQRLHDWFEYVPKSTKVDSPIDEAIENHRGVCQDFAHIMIALARTVQVPARYVSGYLHPKSERERPVAAATHAWIEAFLPPLGWVGFDPTNRLITGDGHIRTAVGRDYADVPPTKGIFRGQSASELSVAVRVAASESAPELDQSFPVPEDWSVLVEKAQEAPAQAAPAIQQMQQQQ